MQTSSITSKGQVTIPANIRKSLHLTAGQKVKVSCENNIITITPVENDISAVFGFLKATKTVSLAQMEEACSTHQSTGPC
ncbi:AbrB/MazE/SpoVT family DNA-binding domain-containing protein [Methylobacter sp.]|uniref:AbrB/MazE/SpoVT family DNA-binding domain-containing protein n=1 Tax=Methylobacter sp. TaxID=2051955 RepID=UPI00248855AF|nr:AbrB/MazE/SpoVT family DNA-binding domain-containing protein [Methylobacter sp.]MDI1276674.1 AbrB/MazE/SpoVT family DNA-binding domain-containing protein [Methylobacter sp.]MDI1357343.1 AbrB/MazE/SpoVT family DNA-binding domain-containing protein [Methylobacter sp.]